MKSGAVPLNMDLHIPLAMCAVAGAASPTRNVDHHYLHISSSGTVLVPMWVLLTLPSAAPPQGSSDAPPVEMGLLDQKQKPFHAPSASAPTGNLESLHMKYR